MHLWFFPHPTSRPNCAPAPWAPQRRAARPSMPPHTLGAPRVAVHEPPPTCGKSHEGQTGRRVNDRTREHANNPKKDTIAHPSAHCKTRSRVPRFSDARTPRRSHAKTAREPPEAPHIKEKNDDCVSQTSLPLYNAEHNPFKSPT
uniref:Tick transposon n=1 Tax=Rhipicephalus appendiculatus TaxID=34631 RepID=A0A131YGU6_RHIAP